MSFFNDIKKRLNSYIGRSGSTLLAVTDRGKLLLERSQRIPANREGIEGPKDDR